MNLANILQEKTSTVIKKLSKSQCSKRSYTALSKSQRPQKGYINVYVGQERKLYQLPLKYLLNPSLQQLIKKSEPDVFDAKIEGPIELACTSNTFDQLLKIFKK
ncbi:auxin-induced protein 6B-like [Pyrus ussuriensis x Pyrus communis]|uniref:Auxin-induced protein 6B-like n=1 Tax=Pyrus ussuriensis x Pyrus communis TaxID=2448454 RepID=A0A5N5GVC5_9ROSA|nr:auxin-induced protein 6B-like [Pyrus ussuriensis x Pyrus communis]